MSYNEPNTLSVNSLRDQITVLRDDMKYMQAHFAEFKEEIKMLRHTIHRIDKTILGLDENSMEEE